jgi:hypothetical protein
MQANSTCFRSDAGDLTIVVGSTRSVGCQIRPNASINTADANCRFGKEARQDA